MLLWMREVSKGCVSLNVCALTVMELPLEITRRNARADGVMEELERVV